MKVRTWAVLATVGVLALAAALHVLFAPPPHLSAWRDGPEDLSEFRGALVGQGYSTASIGASPHVVSAYGDPGQVVVVVAGVERPYRPGEIDALVSFVEEGGTLIVADDLGFANALSDRFGVSFDRVRLFDANYEVDPSLVTVRAELDGKTYPLVLNVPTGLSVSNPAADVLAVSSEAGYLDTNGNGVKDGDDVQQAMIVAVRVPRGEGSAVFLGDPALFTNAMLPRGSDRDFVLDLVITSLGTEAGTVVFDESRHARNVFAAGAGLAIEALVVATHEGWLRFLALGTVAAAAAAWLRLRKREERLGHHEGQLDRSVRVKVQADRVRLQALARARLADVHKLAADATAEAYRSVATDEVVGRLAAGDDGLNIHDSLDDILRRLEAYGRRGTTSASSVYGQNT